MFSELPPKSNAGLYYFAAVILDGKLLSRLPETPDSNTRVG
jgi:hypothetical protein